MAFDLSTGRSGRKRRARPDMNVTPLVDVVLVLLIIFMVITPMLAKQFWIHLPSEPQAEPPPTSDQAPIVVTVDQQGVVRINRDVVQLAELGPRIRRALAARSNRTIFFDASNDAPYGAAVEALDAARGGGATTIAVSTQSLTD